MVVGRRCCAAPILGQSGSSAPPCWTLDVLNIVRRITEAKRAVVLDCGGKRSATPLSPQSHTSSQSGVTAAALQNEFTAADVYVFERELEKLHPDISKAEG
jgi:hypothetical protein